MSAAGYVRGTVSAGVPEFLRHCSVFKGATNSLGLTLIELMLVITIIGSLAVALRFSYADWMSKYKVEKATKELYVDLMNVRCMAMTRNRLHFLDFNFPAPSAGQGTYRIVEDTDDDCKGDADANGIIDAGGHTVLPSFPKTVEYPITFSKRIINFNTNGLVEPKGQALGGTICFFTDNDPDYDCIVIAPTRISIGKLKNRKATEGHVMRIIVAENDSLSLRKK